MLNDKWVSVDAILERVGRMFPDLEVPRGSAAEWCFEVVRELGVFPAFVEKSAQLEVKNNTVQLPCDLFRILHALPHSSTNIAYTSAGRQSWYALNEGGFMNVRADAMYGTPSSVNLQYLAFQTDAHGYPMIFEAAAEAAAFYIVMKMKTADFIGGNMERDKFFWLKEQYETELGYARNKTMRWTTREDLDKIVRVARSMIRPAHYAAR